MDLLLILQLLSVAGLVLLAVMARTVLPSYLSEKAKNLATKEDIEEITGKIERIKNQLSQEIEVFKSNLARDLHESGTRFSRLDRQRSEGVMQIHGRMCDIEQALIWKVAPASSARISLTPETRAVEALNEAWQSVADLSHALNYHSLLLPEDLYLQVQAWCIEVFAAVAAIGNQLEPLRRGAALSTNSIEDREAMVIAITNKHLVTHLPRLGEKRKEIEKDFLAVLGSAYGEPTR